jgi:hypothetical protein
VPNDRHVFAGLANQEDPGQFPLLDLQIQLAEQRLRLSGRNEVHAVGHGRDDFVQVLAGRHIGEDHLPVHPDVDRTGRGHVRHRLGGLALLNSPQIVVESGYYRVAGWRSRQVNHDLGVRTRRQPDPAGHQCLATVDDGYGPRTVLDRKGSRHLAPGQRPDQSVTVDSD